jgi:beta-lactamase regulating signal transducer with metallopeptidase domain
MTPFVAALLLKVTLILTLALVVVAVMRAFAPSVRHVILLGALGAGLALPVLMAVSPQWNVALLPADAGPTLPVASRAVDASVLASLATPRTESRVGSVPAAGAIGRQSIVERTPTRSIAGRSPLEFLPLIWLIGFVSVIGWLVIGRFRLDHIAGMSWPLTDTEWTRILDEERSAAGVSRPVRLLSSPAVSTPLTWGWRAPVILLPEDAVDWAEAHRRIVLRHELAHIARSDALAQLLAGVACAAYWFHPLVWVVERRMRAECERACDDTVVSHGTPAAEYAAHLLEVARSARSFGAPGFLSVAMARPSQLEGRLLAVLSESRRRVSLSRGARLVAAILVALIVVPLAAFRAVPKSAPAAGSIAPSTTLSLVAASDNTDGKVDPTEHEALPLVPQGQADTTFELSAAARNGGTLELDLKTGGNVTVTSWDRPQILVHASLAGRDWRRTRVTLAPTSDGARLESRFSPSGGNQSSRHSFEITVPRQYDVRISSSGGSISLSGLNGTFSGNTGGGEIDIRNSSGEATIQTGGGDIRVRDSRLAGQVSTGGGTVRIEGVTGNLSGSSGSGPVVISKRNGVSVTRSGGVNIVGVSYGDSATIHAGGGSGSGSGSGTTISSYSSSGGSATTVGGPISVNSAGGGLSLPSAPEGARVVTGGGAIHVGPSAGSLYVSTGGGPIDVGPARGSVAANTGAGDVSVQLEGASGHTVDISSGTGRVELLVPTNLDAVLDLETAYTESFGRKTRIISDIPVQVTETTAWDDRDGTPRRYVRTRQTVGRGGPVIKVRTVNGDIVLRRTP